MNTVREISVHEEATERLRFKSILKQIVLEESTENLVKQGFAEDREIFKRYTHSAFSVKSS